MKLSLPPEAAAFLRRLRAAGYESYLVGGAVRDLLENRPIGDVDVATPATPAQVAEVFSDCRVIPTGLAHGTQTVVLEGASAEITTFRVEGGYSDSRHPDTVEFVQELEADLARRDFTVGAMALSLDGELTDPFGGREDLSRRILRAVGESELRFEEDALRILRALRLCSEYGFELEEQTRRAAFSQKARLGALAKERIYPEFCRLVCGKYAEAVLLWGREILSELIEGLSPCFDFDQQSIYHCYDVYTHTAKTVGEIERTLPLRLAAFFHDLGKPAVYVFGEDGHGHFAGHAAVSCRIAHRALSALGAPLKVQKEVCALIEHHDEILTPTKKCVRRALLRHGEEHLRALIRLELADAKTHAAWIAEQKSANLAEFERILDEQIAAGAAFSLATLAIGGDDLLALGMPQGKKIGATLETLLFYVVEGDLENERHALLAAAQNIWKNTKEH